MRAKFDYLVCDNMRFQKESHCKFFFISYFCFTFLYNFLTKVKDNGYLSMENMTKVFLKFQTKDEWKAVITESINYCFSEMQSTCGMKYTDKLITAYWKCRRNSLQ